MIKTPYFTTIVLLVALLGAATADARAEGFSIGVIAPTRKATSEDSVLRQAISETDDDNLAFVVVNGIKSEEESCSDALYLERKLLIDSAKNGLIVSLAASDWADCKTGSGRSAAMERLNRLRELFFAEDFSFGTSKIPLSRQSSAAKFRSFSENARWEVGPIQFATINLPADNNHYLAAAGRNTEFEDRQVANHEWLQRLITIATRRKLSAVVLFCDGDPFAPVPPTMRRNGFAEIRNQLTELATTFPGRILLIHSRTPPSTGTPAAIRWTGRLGTLAIAPGWLRLNIEPGTPALITIGETEAKPATQAGVKKTASLAK